MRKIFILLPCLSLLFISCQTAKTPLNTVGTLDGSWKLNYVSGPRIAFEGLYPNAKPIITFNTKEKTVSGKNSCNSYSGSLNVEGSKIDFRAPMLMTKMFCPGEGDEVYMATLQKIDSYTTSDNGKTLNLMMGDVALMRFEKQ